MGTPHKHCDLIVAWANGADIQFFDDGQWIDCNENNPRWHEEMRYRVKPKIVKREGWVTIHRDAGGTYVLFYETKQKADSATRLHKKSCIRIEWEEEI